MADSFKYDSKLIAKLREAIPKLMAQELCKVQPFSNNLLLKGIYSDSYTESELKENGYVPIDSTTKILWRKDI